MTGGGWSVGAQHNHNLESWFVHSPGLKVVMPSTPYDFKGLLKAAIRDHNPVIFFTDLALSYQTGNVPVDDYVVPLGKAAIRREGTDVTIITYAKTVHTCLEAAGILEKNGVSAEVIDLRSLKPVDEDTILRSVHKTGRVLVVHEASRMCGVGAEIAAIVAERAYHSLKAPVLRVTGPDVPAPSSYPLEQAFIPQARGIVEAVSRLID